MPAKAARFFENCGTTTFRITTRRRFTGGHVFKSQRLSAGMGTIDCVNKCKGDEDCWSFNYEKNRKVCYLMSSTNDEATLSRAGAWSSGYRECVFNSSEWNNADIGFGAGEGATATLSCPAGEEPNAQGTSCGQCQTGYYKSATDGSACLQCPTGYTTSAAGSTASTDCIVCDTGYMRGYDDGNGDVLCIQAAPGFTNSGTFSVNSLNTPTFQNWCKTINSNSYCYGYLCMSSTFTDCLDYFNGNLPADTTFTTTFTAGSAVIYGGGCDAEVTSTKNMNFVGSWPSNSQFTNNPQDGTYTGACDYSYTTATVDQSYTFSASVAASGTAGTIEGIFFGLGMLITSVSAA